MSTRTGVVVMHHGPGIDHFMGAQVAALASHGYLVECPDLFHRQPDDDGADTMMRIGRLRDDEIIEDADGAIARLRDRGAEKLAVLGFCMGGRNTYLLAGARPDAWSAVGVFYGGNIFVAWPADGTSPFDRTAQIRCPLIGFFGNDDTNPSPADVDRIDAALTQHGVAHEFHRYDGAGHAFMNFTNAQRHRPAAAADAWPKMIAFLALHL